MMTLDEATKLAPTIPIPTPVVMEIARVLSNPVAYAEMTNRQTIALIGAIDNAIDQEFARAREASSTAAETT